MGRVMSPPIVHFFPECAVLRYTGTGRHEPAVAQAALTEVIRASFVQEKLRVRYNILLERINRCNGAENHVFLLTT